MADAPTSSASPPARRSSAPGPSGTCGPERPSRAILATVLEGLSAAFASHLCCVLPPALASLGIGGAAGGVAWGTAAVSAFLLAVSFWAGPIRRPSAWSRGTFAASAAIVAALAFLRPMNAPAGATLGFVALGLLAAETILWRRARGRSARDPVCGMSVSRSEAVATVRHDGRDYSFCRASCAAEFRRHPGRYSA